MESPVIEEFREHHEKEKENFNVEEQRAGLSARLGRGDVHESELDLTDAEVEFLLEKISSMTDAEAREILETAVEYHKTDPNFHENTLNTIKKLLDGSPELELDAESRLFNMRMEAVLLHDHSPYPEVRSVADPYDDPTMPVETFRAYLLGIIWVLVGTGVNQFFEPRLPPVSITDSLLQLLVYPCGKLFERLPDVGFTFRGKRHSLNPGPWTYKEQLLVTIMFNITNSLAYINDQIFVQRLEQYYDNKWAGFGYQFTLMLSTQYIGFGLAGLVRHTLVYPVSCIWPGTFPVLALNRALLKPEKQETINGWKYTRYRFFFYVFLAMFFYFWIPDYLFNAVSIFNWMTWIAPNNFNLGAITGGVTGLGVNPIPTFDWNVITFATPLINPFFSSANIYFGALIGGCILIPAVYWSNMYNTAYLPINSSDVWTNTGELYEVTNVLDSNGVLDNDLYQKYSPPYYSAANLVVYGVFFAMYPAIIVDSGLRHWRTMSDGVKVLFKSITGKIALTNTGTDAHSRMMRSYKEVPIWWYGLITLIALALGIVSVEIYPTETPVWGIFFSLALGVIFLIPIGVLYATTNALFSLNVLTELVAGYALPGKGVALMIIKAFGLNTNLQAMFFIQDQKMAHYGKIPPRATFRAQLTATFISAIVVLGVANWQIDNIKDICTPDNRQKFSCPNESVYYSASVVWGVIGPKRVFNSLYPVLQYCFLIGAFIPIPMFLLEKYWKKPILRQINPILWMFGIISYFAPFNLYYATGGMYFSYAFMYYIRNRYTAWFEKYNYILSAGLDAGVAFSAVIIFFAVQFKEKDLNWWGNEVLYAGQDGLGGSLLPIPDQGFFGIPPGSYPF